MKNKTSKNFRNLILPLIGFLPFAYGQDVLIDAFSPPEPVERVNPDYPSRPLNKSEEGWVQLEMMIDTEGKPFEIMVSNSAGDSAFEAAAMKAMKDWKFEPATINGEPTVASVQTILRFMIEGQRGARRRFVSAYKLFVEGLQSKPQQEVTELLAVLDAVEGTNSYELAYLNLAQYLYASKFGTSLEQMDHLDAALSFSREGEDQVYLPKQEEQFARRELIRLQVKNMYLQEAIETYQYFEEVEDKEAIDTFKPIVAQLDTIKQNEEPYEIAATLDEGGHFGIRLFKNQVYVTAIEGKVVEFQLRCERQYVGFAVEADVAYGIKEEWGVCGLEVVGDAGTKFNLGQM